MLPLDLLGRLVRGAGRHPCTIQNLADESDPLFVGAAPGERLRECLTERGRRRGAGQLVNTVPSSQGAKRTPLHQQIKRWCDSKHEQC
jgi:hypothetical protein